MKLEGIWGILRSTLCKKMHLNFLPLIHNKYVEQSTFSGGFSSGKICTKKIKNVFYLVKIKFILKYIPKLHFFEGFYSNNEEKRIACILVEIRMNEWRMNQKQSIGRVFFF